MHLEVRTSEFSLSQESLITRMASQSSKKTAVANSQTLKELHLISLTINLVVILVLFVLHRPASKWKYFLLSLPALGCEMVLERSGRPLYAKDTVTGLIKLLKSGDNIKGPGLFEYMFDCIYITWICDVLMVLFGSNKVWYLILIVPGFLAYKITSVAKSFMGGKSNVQPHSPSDTTSDSGTGGKSKRQAKLEQRSQKQQRVRVR